MADRLEASPTVPSSARIPELDGLRGIAILLVLIWHVFPEHVGPGPSWLVRPWSMLQRFGWTGVDLFFVLSGFLIGGILLDNRGSARYFRTFYTRRAFRILPVYLVMLAMFVVLRPLHLPPPVASLFSRRIPFWSYATLTQNYAMARAREFGAPWLGPTWSLAIEEQFYLVLPLIVRFVPRRRLWLVLTAAALLAPVTRLVLWGTMPAPSMAMYTWTPARADALMLGVLAAIALRRPDVREFVAARRRAGFLILLGLLMVVAAALGDERLDGPRTALFGYSVFALLYTVALILAVTAAKDDIFGRSLRLPALRWTGGLAYCIYLIHLPVSSVVNLITTATAPHLILTMASIYLVAWLSSEYFEKPLLRIGHRYRY
jgi:peptidoglycan/LPS O-acetylase OafA/YrhL